MRTRPIVPARVRRPDGDPEGRLEELARAAADGDACAFDDLVRGIFGRIQRWALTRLADPDDADDVTQAVLVRLHARLATWKEEGSFEAWLYRITANECSSWRRRVARRLGRRESFRRREIRRREAASVAGSEALDRRELEELVAFFFDRLPPRQREVFDLVDLQGYAPAEVSQMLDLNPNTVRANLFKARRAIRARILERMPGALELLR